MTHRVANEEEMMELGRQAATKSAAGDIWCLSGDLGAGKTHWTKGLVEGIGSPSLVTSPTFGLVHEYPGGRCPVFHFDFYRIESMAELLEMGWDEYLERDGIVVVEWAERYPEAFPAEVRKVRITAQQDGSREVEW